MSWLLFLDESGHDQRTTPYEVNGGIALHISKLWPFIQAVRTLEQSIFGTFLHNHGSEIKGYKLLAKTRFIWEQQGPKFDDQARRKHALNFLNSASQMRQPRRDEFTAFGQACIQMAQGLCELVKSHDAVLFASFIPHIKRPDSIGHGVPRKDMVFLLERFCYLLQETDEMGLLVLDQTDKNNDRKLVQRMERYFVDTMKGKKRAQWIVPAPLFVESDMAYGVQVADVCIYCLNWAYRFHKDMTEPIRQELVPFARLLEGCMQRFRYDSQTPDKVTHSVCYIPDPYTSKK